MADQATDTASAALLKLRAAWQDKAAELRDLVGLVEPQDHPRLSALLIIQATTIDECKSDLEAVLASLPAPAAPGQWQPIETAPKDGTLIIGALVYGGRVRIHEMRHNGLAFYTSGGASVPQMTHWMPFQGPAPAAPEEEKRG